MGHMVGYVYIVPCTLANFEVKYQNGHDLFFFRKKSRELLANYSRTTREQLFFLMGGLRRVQMGGLGVGMGDRWVQVWVDRGENLASSFCISYEVKYMKIETGKTSPRFIFGPEIFTL